MIRWMCLPLVSLTFLPAANASLATRQRPEHHLHLPTDAFASFRPASANDEFRLTTKTEVLVDGRPCRYAEVPEGATIILLETVSNENKEILKIHFRTIEPTRTLQTPR